MSSKFPDKIHFTTSYTHRLYTPYVYKHFVCFNPKSSYDLHESREIDEIIYRVAHEMSYH